MRRWLPWAALGAVWVASCSSDGDEPASASTDSGAGGAIAEVASGGGGAPPSPSAGGEANGGDGGRDDGAAGAPNAGAPNAGAPNAGAPNPAGTGGVGGAPLVPTEGELCLARSERDACGATSRHCLDNPECAPWLACLSACDDASCANLCDDSFGDARRLLPAVYSCLCASKEPACAVLGACEKTSCVAAEELTPTPEAPQTLAETGWLAQAGVYDYAPQFPLWSDGLEKERRVWIPGCATIDTSNMDEWKFPVGTRLWKTFALAGAAIETRLSHRYGPGNADWLYAAYLWDPRAPGDAARAIATGGAVVSNANGTGHDIPGNGNCKQCHDGRKERALGFSAIQLGHESSTSGLTLRRISELGWLTVPAPNGFSVPGDTAQRAALGYLHGNCGGCHDQDAKLPDPESPLILRLLVGQTEYAQTDAVRTTVNVPVRSALGPLAGKDRVEPGEPGNSGILVRMQARGIAGIQMPPFNSNSTKQPDTTGGVADVTRWVSSLSR